MNKVKGYIVNDSVLESWNKKFVPDFDLFFFAENHEYVETELFTFSIKNDFSLDDRTSFVTWGISDKAKFYAKIHNDDFLKLSKENQKEIIKQQWVLGRGVLFKESELLLLLKNNSNENLKTLEVLKDYSIEEDAINEKIFILQGHTWKRLSPLIRKSILLNYADLWVNDNAVFHNLKQSEQDSLSKEYPHLIPFIDHFPSRNGPNCFASVIAVVTGDLNHMNDWMQSEQFIKLLKQHNYLKTITTNYKKQDVLVWKNQNGTPVHAAFLLNDKLSFNKHGQTMFNPWQVLPTSDVIKSWNNDGFQLEVFRREFN
ncbi:hypothetical protein CIB95_04235 [Lottiidibacillus patelloidae]|uniref:Uncharacterized protein n=1 Tax=Lottiidibacillus patelloidae TaxID=2670334 RepID=A0A263BWM1_9BACI|nr:hypothetical protein [Lottiidibacillus patelloidae]OZM57586.1 hypothetical protein CIB95_04235 [Lottiidibacillus patelloidae]